MYVTKVSTDGSGLDYSTYLGGDQFDNFEEGYGIAVDSDGSAYVTGDLGNNGDFPTTPGAFQTAAGGGRDAFVTKLSPDGSSLVYSTYLGGGSDDQAFGIALDSSKNAYVTGSTHSTNSVCTGISLPLPCCTGFKAGKCNFPTTAGAFQSVNNAVGNGDNAFVTKLNNDGTGLVYSTYLGGGGTGPISDRGQGIAVDSALNAYVTGITTATDFPVTANAFQTQQPSSVSTFSSPFVTKLKTDGTELVYSTYMGGNEPDVANGIAVDSTGHAYVTGYTESNNFPTTAGAFNGVFQNASFVTGFVTKLKTDGTGLTYSTYLGGSVSNDVPRGIAVDSFGNAYIAGDTRSGDFPITPDAFQTGLRADRNAFVTKLNAGGSALIYSTFLGGTVNEFEYAIAVDSLGNAYVTGTTGSSDFPITAGAFQTTFGGVGDTFVTKLIVPAGPTPTPTPTASPTPSPSPTPTKSPTPTPTPTKTPTPTPTATPSVTPTPTPTATPTPVPGKMTVAPPSVGFMSVGTDTVKSKTLTVKNSAKSGVLTGQVAAGSPPFTVTAGPVNFSLSAGQKQSVTVQFAPTAPGAASATLAITSNDPKKPIVNVKLSGTGAAGKLTVPARLAFAKTTVNTSSQKTLTIKNGGLGLLHVTVSSSTGPFAVTAGGGAFNLNNKASHAVTIQFIPAIKGSANGTLAIISDDPKHVSFSVNLKGVGK